MNNQYERIVSYIYRYDKGQKGMNVGFARVERKGQRSRITVQLRASLTQKIHEGYLFWQQPEGIRTIPMGRLALRSGNFVLKADSDTERLFGTELGLGQIEGIFIDVEKDVYYATTWKNDSFHLGDWREWKDGVKGVPVAGTAGEASGQGQANHSAGANEGQKEVKAVEEQDTAGGTDVKGQRVVPGVENRRTAAGVIVEEQEPTATARGSRPPVDASSAEKQRSASVSPSGREQLAGVLPTGKRSSATVSPLGRGQLAGVLPAREQPQPGASSTGKRQSAGVSPVGEQPQPGVSSTGKRQLSGVSPVGEQPQPGVSSTGKRQSAGILPTGGQPQPGVLPTGKEQSATVLPAGEQPSADVLSTGNGPSSAVSPVGNQGAAGVSPTVNQKPAAGMDVVGNEEIVKGGQPAHYFNAGNGTFNLWRGRQRGASPKTAIKEAASSVGENDWVVGSESPDKENSDSSEVKAEDGDNTQEDMQGQLQADMQIQSICSACPFKRKNYDYGKKILMTFPSMKPFPTGIARSCVRMELQDIGCLPVASWQLAGNRFLLHGYYCYRHLLFAQMEDGGYVLGVPGVFSDKERRNAARFGFDTFQAIGEPVATQGVFGYWLMDMKPTA